MGARTTSIRRRFSISVVRCVLTSLLASHVLIWSRSRWSFLISFLRSASYLSRGHRRRSAVRAAPHGARNREPLGRAPAAPRPPCPGRRAAPRRTMDARTTRRGPRVRQRAGPTTTTTKTKTKTTTTNVSPTGGSARGRGGWGGGSCSCSLTSLFGSSLMHPAPSPKCPGRSRPVQPPSSRARRRLSGVSVASLGHARVRCSLGEHERVEDTALVWCSGG